ncbi:MAG: DUF3658 domain-containing protein [Stellaceae bacterium]
MALVDDLTFGPINPAEPRARVEWIAQGLGFDFGEVILAQIEGSWSEALGAADRRVVWMSRRSGRDYAGFLEWLWRLGDEPCDVVDLTEARFPGHCAEGPAGYLSLVISLGFVPRDQIVTMGLLDRAAPLAPAARARYRKIWRQLRTENAPLRVVSETGLSSAPITFYDDELLSYAETRWLKVARIVGEALANQQGFARCDDLLLAARVCALANAGRLEARGNPLKMRFSEARLPAGGACAPVS